MYVLVGLGRERLLPVAWLMRPLIVIGVKVLSDTQTHCVCTMGLLGPERDREDMGSCMISRVHTWWFLSNCSLVYVVASWLVAGRVA